MGQTAIRSTDSYRKIPSLASPPARALLGRPYPTIILIVPHYACTTRWILFYWILIYSSSSFARQYGLNNPPTPCLHFELESMS